MRLLWCGTCSIKPYLAALKRRRTAPMGTALDSFFFPKPDALPLQEDKGTPFGSRPGANASCCSTWIEIAFACLDMQTAGRQTGGRTKRKVKLVKKAAPWVQLVQGNQSDYLNPLVATTPKPSCMMRMLVFLPCPQKQRC